MAKSALPVRAQSARLIAQIIRQQHNLSDLLANAPKFPDPRDQSLLQELCFGTCRWFYPLQSILDQLTQKPFKPKDSDIRALALIGLYQLIHLQTPDHAAVSETVAACQPLGKRWASKLLNAILRRFLREQSNLIADLEAIPEAHWSLPQWLIDQICSDWPDEAASIREALLQRPPMSLRVNRLKYSREAYLDLLQQANIESHPLTDTTAGIQLTQACAVGQLPAFEQGALSVQDGAAQLASELLDVQPGHRVLDACAAPGGKTAHLLEMTPTLGELTALDVQADRCEKLHQTLARLGLSATVVCADARYPGNWYSGELFDRILIDAPCTATGVIRRHPDIKLLRQPTDIDSITQIQRQLLDALWPLLKPTGQLLYTTCSILKAENQHQIEAFIDRHPDASESKIHVNWGIECGVGRQRLPGEQGMDGFYYARLVKAA